MITQGKSLGEPHLRLFDQLFLTGKSLPTLCCQPEQKIQTAISSWSNWLELSSYLQGILSWGELKVPLNHFLLAVVVDDVIACRSSSSSGSMQRLRCKLFNLRNENRNPNSVKMRFGLNVVFLLHFVAKNHSKKFWIVKLKKSFTFSSALISLWPGKDYRLGRKHEARARANFFWCVRALRFQWEREKKGEREREREGGKEKKAPRRVER